MKIKKLSIALLLLLSILSLSACQQQQIDPKYADYIQTDMSKLKEHELYEGETFCGHRFGYHAVNNGVAEIVDNEEIVDTYIDEKSGSEDFGIVDFVKYANISKEAYTAYVEKTYPLSEGDKKDDLERREELLADIEVIYSDDEVKINNYYNQNECTYHADANDEEPTKNFFVTHGALVRHVGTEKYHEYLKHVIGTKYDNAKNFIEYFKLDKSTVEELLKSAEAPDFYDLDDLF